MKRAVFVIVIAGAILLWRVFLPPAERYEQRAVFDWVAQGGAAGDCTPHRPAEPAFAAVICRTGAESSVLIQFDRFGRRTVSPSADPASAIRSDG